MPLTRPSPGSKASTYRGKKDFRVLVKTITKAGGEMRMPRHTGGHPQVFYQGKHVTSVPLTPSDSRSYKNVLAACRRAGMQV
ncbi:HicA-like toxin [Gordonia phage Marietta]|uniref:HicA-like toxin n=1 Tax=Gordonia phage Marietta TaxID=2301558 RepID=A0A385DR56_9CAUD|nr:HicA-like toxin [Gordonia phage Marietta]AXQ61327.1 HicA-like toxin [Gordonia phage Marietta]QAU06334.1 HicA-like toxin [Gordonia phage WhoseManz]